MECVEFVRLRLVSGSIDDLKALRPQILGDFKRRYEVDAELHVLEDGTLLDVWRWESRLQADEALADQTISEAFKVWQSHVELLSVEWSDLTI